MVNGIKSPQHQNRQLAFTITLRPLYKSCVILTHNFDIKLQHQIGRLMQLKCG
jgi:hypothetical protein